MLRPSYYFTPCLAFVSGSIFAMELPDTLKKSSQTIAHFLEDNQNQSTAPLSIHGHVIKDLLKHDLSTEELCSPLLAKKDPEELAQIITAADFLEMPALIVASLATLKERIQSKEWCFYYNAHPEKINALVDSLTPPTQHALELLFCSHTDFKNAKFITTEKIFSKRPRQIIPRKDGTGVLIVGKEASFATEKTVISIPLHNHRSEHIVLHQAESGKKFAFSDTGKQMATLSSSWSKSPEVAIHSTLNASVITLKNIPKFVYRIAFIGPENNIILKNKEGLSLWNSTTGEQLSSIDTTHYASLLGGFATHQKSSNIAVSVIASKNIHWYTASKSKLAYAGSLEFFDRVPSALAFNREGTFLAVGFYDETISLVCPIRNTLLTTLPALNYIPHRICFSDQDTLFILPKNNSGTAHLIVPEKLPLLTRIAATIAEKLPVSAVNKKIRDLNKQ